MTAYGLYLESGPQRRTTMVHVLDLLGCVANAKTTEAALEATPEAIRSFIAFLRAQGAPVDAPAQFTTSVVEHITEGEWLGNGSPYLVFQPDLKPVTPREVETWLARMQAIYGALADWAAAQPDRALDAKPVQGRTARAILLHVLGTPGAYLSAALGGAAGFSRIAGAAERGELPLADSFRRMLDRFDEVVRGTSREQRAAVRELGGGLRVYTLRKALRRSLEHGWEHLAELSRRPGGPG